MYRLRLMMVGSILLPLMAGACGADFRQCEPIQLQIRKISGDGQSGSVQSELQQPLVVKVFCVLLQVEEPVSGVQVTWKAIGDSGSLVDGNQNVTTASTLTGSDGRSSIRWVLGPTAGTQRVQAQAPYTATFTATAVSP